MKNCFSIVQGNNQMFSSPVNRIRITGTWASRSLATDPQLSFTQRLQEWVNHTVFLAVMFSIDVAFLSSKVRQWVRTRVGLSSDSFEDELEKAMRGMAKKNFGVEITDEAFAG